MKTGVEKIIQAKGGDAPAKNQTGVQKIIELLGGDPPAKNQTGVDKIVEILENGGGGGNPNRVQTITGTAANPFGDVFDDLMEGINNNTASATLSLDGSALGEGTYLAPVFLSNYNELQVTLIAITNLMTGSTIGLVGDWNDGGLVLLCKITTDGGEGTSSNTSLYEYASLIPTTLTIIWHPLPDQS